MRREKSMKGEGMLSVSIVKQDGKYVDDSVLLELLLNMNKGEGVEYNEYLITLIDIEVSNNRNYIHVNIAPILIGNLDPFAHGNIDTASRHNIAGDMNKPARHERDYDDSTTTQKD